MCAPQNIRLNIFVIYKSQNHVTWDTKYISYISNICQHRTIHPWTCFIRMRTYKRTAQWNRNIRKNEIHTIRKSILYQETQNRREKLIHNSFINFIKKYLEKHNFFLFTLKLLACENFNILYSPIFQICKKLFILRYTRLGEPITFVYNHISIYFWFFE